MAMMKKKHKYLSELETPIKSTAIFYKLFTEPTYKKKVIRTLNISLFSERVSAKQKQIQLNVQ